MAVHVPPPRPCRGAEPTLSTLQGRRGPETQRVLGAGAGRPRGAGRVLCPQERQEAPRYVSPGRWSPLQGAGCPEGPLPWPGPRWLHSALDQKPPPASPQATTQTRIASSPWTSRAAPTPPHARPTARTTGARPRTSGTRPRAPCTAPPKVSEPQATPQTSAVAPASGAELRRRAQPPARRPPWDPPGEDSVMPTLLLGEHEASRAGGAGACSRGPRVGTSPPWVLASPRACGRGPGGQRPSGQAQLSGSGRQWGS